MVLVKLTIIHWRLLFLFADHAPLFLPCATVFNRPKRAP